MIEDSDHIEQIIKYLDKNNLRPFTMHTDDGLLFITEVNVESFAKLKDSYRKYLIDLNSFEKKSNGELFFKFREALFSHFDHYDSDFGWHYNKLLTNEYLDQYVIRKSNILTKTFKRYFWKSEPVQEQRFYGNIFKKSQQPDKPFMTGHKNNRSVSHYVLTLLD